MTHLEEDAARQRMDALHRRVAEELLAATGSPYVKVPEVMGCQYFTIAADQSLWSCAADLTDVVDLSYAQSCEEVPTAGLGASELNEISDALERWLQEPIIAPMTAAERTVVDRLSDECAQAESAQGRGVSP